MLDEGPRKDGEIRFGVAVSNLFLSPLQALRVEKRSGRIGFSLSTLSLAEGKKDDKEERALTSDRTLLQAQTTSSHPSCCSPTPPLPLLDSSTLQLAVAPPPGPPSCLRFSTQTAGAQHGASYERGGRSRRERKRGLGGWKGFGRKCRT
jgi:hypothetical protein